MVWRDHSFLWPREDFASCGVACEMKSRVTTILASILGSFAVYCASAVPTNGSTGRGTASEAGGGGGAGAGTSGFVSDARADSPAGACCAPAAPKYTRLASGSLMAGNTSAPIAVGAFRDLVVYATGAGVECKRPNYSEFSTISARFRPDASTPFGRTGQYLASGGRLRVDGADLILTLDSLSGATCTGSFDYVVAGVE
jgi:hypothetical protein